VKRIKMFDPMLS